MAIIRDETLLLIRDEIAKRNDSIRNLAILFANDTWQTVQANVRSGHGAELYPLGTEMVCHYVFNGMTYDFPWIVVENNRNFKLDTGITVPGLVLQAKYATIEAMPFDAPEHEVATELTAQPGVYYCGFKSNSYKMLNLNVGDEIPYDSYTYVYRGSINNHNVYSIGYNRWSMSAARQWLNSDAQAGSWWTSQHDGDTAPTQAAQYDGFMRGLDEDFLSVIQPVHINTVTNNVTDGNVVDDTIDRFWLPSTEEMYGVPQQAGEGPYFPYWKAVMGLDSPTNSSNNARKTRKLDTPSSSTPYNTYFRSAQQSYAHSAWHNLDGSVSTSNVSVAMRFQPVCVLA